VVQALEGVMYLLDIPMVFLLQQLKSFARGLDGVIALMKVNHYRFYPLG
jgi:hypothetical protein